MSKNRSVWKWKHSNRRTKKMLRTFSARTTIQRWKVNNLFCCVKVTNFICKWKIEIGILFQAKKRPNTVQLCRSETLNVFRGHRKFVKRISINFWTQRVLNLLALPYPMIINRWLVYRNPYTRDSKH